MCFVCDLLIVPLFWSVFVVDCVLLIVGCCWLRVVVCCSLLVDICGVLFIDLLLVCGS